MDTLYRLLEWNPVQVGSTFQGGGGPLHMKFSRDSAIPRIPAPHLLKQGQLQLAGASFREKLFQHLFYGRPASRSPSSVSLKLSRKLKLGPLLVCTE